MLKLKNISKKFDQLVAVDAIDLCVKKGQTTVLIGPSGCGKSTVLRLIIGLVQPDNGTIEFDGEQLTKDNIMASRHKMGYVIQDGGLFPHLTARENITVMASHLNWNESKIDARLNESIELTQFPEDALNRYPTQLSGGQQQRISLMRALMLDPELLLMDEPLGALDPLIRIGLQTELKAIFQKLQKTVIMVTHDLAEAAYFGDTIVLMQDGKIVQEGTLDQLVRQPANPFVTRFINAQRSPLESLTGVSA